MFKKPFRLKSRGLFKKTLNAVRLFAAPEFVVYSLPWPKPHHNPQNTIQAHKSRPIQFGIIVSKKVSKHAVQRNLLKRRMREIIRASSLTQNGVGVGVPTTDQSYRCMVIIMRGASLNSPYSHLKARFLQGLADSQKKGNLS